MINKPNKPTKSNILKMAAQLGAPHVTQGEGEGLAFTRGGPSGAHICLTLSGLLIRNLVQHIYIPKYGDEKNIRKHAFFEKM